MSRKIYIDSLDYLDVNRVHLVYGEKDDIYCIVDDENASTRINKRACINQGEIYEYSFNTGLDIESFSKECLNSNFFNKDLDEYTSMYNRYDLTGAMYRNLMSEFTMNGIKIKETDENSLIRKKEDAYWVGYAYRFLSIVTDLRSKTIYKRVPIDSLVEFSYLVNSQNYEDVANTLCKNFLLEKAVSNWGFYLYYYSRN